MTTTLIIARHGSVFEPDEMPTRVGTQTDLALTESGKEQARQIGQYLKMNGYLPSQVYSAFLTRTRETANIILDTMRLERDIEHVHMLNEIDYGPDENQPESIVVSRVGRHAIDDWNRMGKVPDGWNVNVDKIKQDWMNLGMQVEATAKGKTALAVTNIGVGGFSLALTGDFGKAVRNYGMKISTGGLCIFTKEPNDNYWQVKDWNIRPKSGPSGMTSRRY